MRSTSLHLYADRQSLQTSPTTEYFYYVQQEQDDGTFIFLSGKLSEYRAGDSDFWASSKYKTGYQQRDLELLWTIVRGLPRITVFKEKRTSEYSIIAGST